MSESRPPRPLDLLLALFHDIPANQGTQYVEFRLLGGGRSSQHFFEIDELFEKWHEIEPRLLSANRKGANIYFGVNPRKELWTAYWRNPEKKVYHQGFEKREDAVALARTKKGGWTGDKPVPEGSLEYVQTCNCLWLDLDYKGETLTKNSAVLKGLNLQPSIVINSGNGYHLYWLLSEPITPEEARRTVKQLIRVMAGDEGTHDPTRILRLPGSQNVKIPGQPLPCTLLRLNPERQYNLSDFDPLEDVAAGEVPQKIGKKPGPKSPSTPSKIPTPTRENIRRYGNGYPLATALADVLSPFWKKSVRHHLAMGLAGMLRREGLAESKTIHIITAVAERAGDDEMTDRETAVKTTYQVSVERCAGSGKVIETLGEKLGRQFLASFNKTLEGIPPAPILRAAFPTFNLYDCCPTGGVFDRYVTLASRLTDAPTQFHLAAILTVAAATLGNTVFIPDYYGSRLFPNLYTLISGPSSRFRKSTSISISRKAGKIAQTPTYPSNATIEALYTRMATEECEWREEEGGKDSKRIPIAWKGRPAGIIYHREFSTFLSMTNKSYMAGSRDFFMDIYDGEADEDMGSKQTKSSGRYYIEDPAISMLAAATYRSLKNFIGRADVETGFLARFLIIMAENSHQNRCDRITRTKDLNSVDEMSAIGGRLGIIGALEGAFSIDDTADNLQVEFQKWINDRIRSIETGPYVFLDPFLARMPAMAIKVAMIYAADNNFPSLVIHAEDMLPAIAICKYSASLLEHFYDEIQPDDGNRELGHKNKVLAAARRLSKTYENRPIPHTILLRSAHLDAEQFSRAVKSLKEESRMYSIKVRRGLGYYLNEKDQ